MPEPPAAAAPRGRRRPRLELYVQAACLACEEALRTVDRARATWPGLDARVVWLDAPGASPPPAVFAVPTLTLDGEVVSLGTPSWPDLAARLRLAFEERGDRDDSTHDDRRSDP